MDTKIIVHTPYHLLVSLAWIESLENRPKTIIYLYCYFDWTSVINIGAIEDLYKVQVVFQSEAHYKSKLSFLIAIFAKRRYNSIYPYRLIGFNDRTFLFTYFNTKRVTEKWVFYEGARAEKKYNHVVIRRFLNYLSRSHAFLPDGRDKTVSRYLSPAIPRDEILKEKWSKFSYDAFVTTEYLSQCFIMSDLDIRNGDVLLFLQPLIEDGILTLEEYQRWICKTIDSFAECRAVIIKTHPRQVDLNWIEKLLPKLNAVRKVKYFDSKVPWEVYATVKGIRSCEAVSYSSSLTA